MTSVLCLLANEKAPVQFQRTSEIVSDKIVDLLVRPPDELVDRPWRISPKSTMESRQLHSPDSRLWSNIPIAADTNWWHLQNKLDEIECNSKTKGNRGTETG